MKNRQSLKLIALLLCGLMLLSVPACKPETVTYPSVVTNPGAETSTEVDPTDKDSEQAKPEQADPEQADPEQAKPEADPEQADPEEEPDQETATTPDQTEPDQAEPEKEETDQQEPEPLPFADHPFAAEGFKPTATTAPSIAVGELIEKADSTLLKDRTLTLYTAGDEPSFRYTNSEGVVVTEWDWMKAIAEEQGLTLKLVRKSNATSLKAQRIALYSGQDLSLVTLRSDELASGLTLCRSAGSYLNKKALPQGISSAVLKQSNQTLFAPIGNIEALWYNQKLMPEITDPHTLYQNNQWTTEMYTAVHLNALEKKVMPLLMESALPWATLSGKSPLTLQSKKLDSNLHAQATRAVWDELRTLNGELTAFAPAKDTTYSLKEKNVAMAYTSIPAADGNTYSYVPLPTFANGETGTVTYCGTFLALPKYRRDADADRAALVFAELWCNRYAETLAASLQALGIAGEGYRAYIALAEEQGSLILYDASIETLAKGYLAGLTDAKVDMEAEYEKISAKLNGIITKYNLNY